MVYPQNPVTTNVKKEKPPMTMSERTFAGAKASGKRVTGQVIPEISNPFDDPAAGPGLIDNLRSALSGAARRSPIASPVQGALMGQGVPRNDAYNRSQSLTMDDLNPPSSPVSQSESYSPIAAALTGPRPDSARPQAPTSMPRELGSPSQFPNRLGVQTAPRDAMPIGFPSDPNLSPQTMRGPRGVPGMDAPGSIVTPEGILADRIAGMSMKPDPAFVQQQMEAAKARGEQQYAASDVAAMQSGRMADMTANRNMGQMAGGNFDDMSPVQGALASRGMYRGGGLGGATDGAREDALEQAARANPAGPSLGQRMENSREGMQGMVAAALQSQGGPDNDWLGLEGNASGLMPGTTLSGTSADGTPMLVSRGNAQPKSQEAIAAQNQTNRNIRGDRMDRMTAFRQQTNMNRNMAMQEAASNPTNSPFFQAFAQQNPQGAANLLAQMSRSQNQYRADTERTRTMATEAAATRTATATEAGEIRKEARAAADQAHAVAMDEIARDTTISDGQRTAFEEAAKRKHELDLRNADNVKELTGAQVANQNAQAGVSASEQRILDASSTPEAIEEAERRTQRGNAVVTGTAPQEYVDGLFEQPSTGNSASTATPSVTRSAQVAESTASATDLVLGQGVSSSKPSAYASAIAGRIGTGSMLSDSDLVSVQRNYRSRATGDPTFRPSTGGSMGVVPSDSFVFEQMLHERMLKPEPITAKEIEDMKKESTVRQETAAKEKNQSRWSNYPGGPR